MLIGESEPTSSAFCPSTIRAVAIPLANPILKSTRTSKYAARQPWTAPAALRLWHLASLDAPTVAVVWALAFGWATRAALEPWMVLMLFCGTFAVYAGDRLLDARRAIRYGDLCRLRERHYFHWRHRHAFVVAALFAAATAGLLILRLMPAISRERNSLIGAAALAYFSGVHSSAKLPYWLRRAGSKELLVALIFTAGCAAPCFWRSHLSGWPLLTCFLFFAAIAWLNCSAIEIWESRCATSRIVIRSVVLALLGLALAVACFNARLAGLLLAGSAGTALLGMLDRTKNRVTSLSLRILADAVLLTPALLLLGGAFHR